MLAALDADRSLIGIVPHMSIHVLFLCAHLIPAIILPFLTLRTGQKKASVDYRSHESLSCLRG